MSKSQLSRYRCDVCVCSFPGVQKPVEEYGSKGGATNGPAAAKDEDEDDDFDLFGSADEEEEVDNWSLGDFLFF